MENKRYRIVPPLQGVQIASSFADRIYTEIPVETPDHPSCFEGEWVCDYTLCPARVVRLRVKAMHHQHLPRLRCPLCLRMLVFRHWLKIIALEEVPAQPASEKKACLSRGVQRSSRPVRRKSPPEAMDPVER